MPIAASQLSIAALGRFSLEGTAAWLRLLLLLSGGIVLRPLLRDPGILPNPDEARLIRDQRTNALLPPQVARHHVPYRLAAYAFTHRRPPRYLVTLASLDRLAAEAQVGDT